VKLDGYPVTDEYCQKFFEAEITFMYQRVYDPMKRQLVHLTPLPSELKNMEMPYLGVYPLMLNGMFI
jgi:exonuclease-1